MTVYLARFQTFYADTGTFSCAGVAPVTGNFDLTSVDGMFEAYRAAERDLTPQHDDGHVFVVTALHEVGR